ESVGIDVDAHGIVVDARLSAGDGLWAVGDITGVSTLRSVAMYQADVAAANILGELRLANYDAVPRLVLTEPRAVAVGATGARFVGWSRTVSDSPTPPWRRRSADPGFLTLLSDGVRLTGAYALGYEADAWAEQLTLAVRARLPLDVLRDTIHPSISFF